MSTIAQEKSTTMAGVETDSNSGMAKKTSNHSTNRHHKRRDETKLRSSFRTQAKALFRKNGIAQRRSIWQNVFIIATPIFFVVLLFVLQKLIDSAITSDRNNKCGCLCLRCCTTPEGSSEKVCRDATEENPCNPWDDCEVYDENVCGIQYSNADQADHCEIASPSIWPPLFQAPERDFLAEPWSPKAAMLMTGDNESIINNLILFPPPETTAAERNASRAFAELGLENDNAVYTSTPLMNLQMGTTQKFPNLAFFIDPAFIPDPPDYNGTMYLMTPDPTSPESQESLVAAEVAVAAAGYRASTAADISVSPLGTEPVYIPSADAINRLLYCGYRDSYCNGGIQINEFTNAWDFSGSNPAAYQYSMRLWYNSTDRFQGNGNAPTQVVRINAALNAATNAFMRWALGDTNTSSPALLVGIMEMPKLESTLRLDIASLIGTLFYTWLLQVLLPVMLATLVSEKEGRLRTMMKMHGLGDVAYWTIQFLWYFILNFIYVWILIGSGSAIGLSFFTRTDYSFQFVFYLLWIINLVSFTFLLSTVLHSTRTAVVTSFLYVFGTGLVGYLLLEQLIAAGRDWVIWLELIPGFALYRGLFEIAQYAFIAAYQDSEGLTWSKLSEPNNGTPAVMIIFAVESIIFMLAAWYIEQVFPAGVGVPRHPLFFLGKRYKYDGAKSTKSGTAVSFWKKILCCFSSKKPVDEQANGNVNTSGKESGEISVNFEPEDVAQERHRVEAITSGQLPQHNSVITIENLRKVFPGGKVAVRDLVLSVERGECFGLLGPNGAGKSSSLNVLTGFLTPTSGTAHINGHDIRSEMDKIYGIMGVCPQDNLLWPQLTAKEHLLFYGRLKNLAGKELDDAVEASLREVNLWNGGVANKQVKAFSGGMKRRLSVAISLIGDPVVVYMDEPSTGLDPASRQNLWSVVKEAKRDRGIILTTHSMEEASVLCNRLGIFVDGQLVCIGAPKELTKRHGGYFVLTLTVSSETEEKKVNDLIMSLSPNAQLTYALAGTRRYEISTKDVGLSEIFRKIGNAKEQGIDVIDWGVSNVTLEEVFIAFAKERGVEGGN